MRHPVPEKILVAPERLVYPESRRFRRAGLELIASLGPQPHRVVVDLSNTVEADSSGLESLIAMRRRATALKHLLVLQGVRPSLHQLLEVTKLDRWFPMEQSSR